APRRERHPAPLPCRRRQSRRRVRCGGYRSDYRGTLLFQSTLADAVALILSLSKGGRGTIAVPDLVVRQAHHEVSGGLSLCSGAIDQNKTPRASPGRVAQGAILTSAKLGFRP